MIENMIPFNKLRNKKSVREYMCKHKGKYFDVHGISKHSYEYIRESGLIDSIDSDTAHVIYDDLMWHVPLVCFKGYNG